MLTRSISGSENNISISLINYTIHNDCENDMFGESTLIDVISK